MFQAVKGATLLIPSGPTRDRDRLHLFILLTNAFVDSSDQVSKVVLVHVSSVKAGVPYDSTCVLNPGDHPFVTHTSYVGYAMALARPVSVLEKGCNRQEFIPKPALKPQVFLRIWQGALASPQMRPRYRGLCKL